MALCQENISHSMLNTGRPSPTFFSHYGGAAYGPGGQVNGANGGPGLAASSQYGGEHGHYSQFHAVPPSLVHAGYGEPSVQQQQQHPQGDGAGTPTHGQWSSSPYGVVPPRPAHVALDEWSQSYLLPTSTGATTTTLHPHQSPYSYSYRSPQGLDGYGPPGPPNSHPGVETSPSTDGSSPPGGGGGSGGASTKQLRPPYEWMKPANTQPQPGKTRTKDKYRVVYSDHQRLELEKEFHFSRYITIRRKAEIAQQLGLSERQVKIWFQNRRAKERKQNKKKEEAMRASGNMTTPKLEPLDSPPAISASHHVHGHAHSPNMGMGMGMSQHHVMSQPTMPGAGPVRGMDVAPNHHLPSPVSQAQPQHYQTHRLSPVSSHGVGLDTLPQTATPSVSQQMQVPVVDSCSTASLRTQNVATPIFEEKREIA